MPIQRIFILAAIVATSAGFAACGFQDFEINDEIPDRCSEGEDCDDDDGAGAGPASEDSEAPENLRSEDRKFAENSVPEPADDDLPEDDSDDDPSTAPDDLDLQCADDSEICRFCGPPVDVVSECSEGDDSFNCQVFEKVNEIRVDHGLETLDYNGTLAESAMIHAMDLNHCDFFAHDSLDGTSFFERCEENGYSGTCTGENIGGGQNSPQAVIDAWMDSPGHRENILYENHTEVGVAFYDEGSGSYNRYWVKHFGRD